MKEIRDILRAFDLAQEQGKQTALATVVHVEGSSYRRPGARMLVTEDGELTGAISGGCLEGDALRKALLVMTQQKAMLVTYDTNDEDDAKFGMGLGCNGIIQVLIEPIDSSQPDNPIELLKRVAAKRQKASLVTLFSLADRKQQQPGTRILVTEDDSILSKGTFLEEVLITDAKEVLKDQRSSFKNYVLDKQNITAFVEFISPSVSMIIIGAGNDVMPLVDMAAIMGWETTVVDGRPAYAKQERFTSSCRVLFSKPENVLQSVSIDEETVFILMTHNYNYDKAMLQVLLDKEVRYIGMLGPKKKFDRILDELNEEGISFSEGQLSIIHSPVGLDIGAETPEEIALSILAEIKSVLAGREATSLRNRTDGIHPRAETRIEEVKLDSR